MALHLSSSSGTVGQTVAQSNDFTVHALRRDKDGMLHYTNARSTESVVYDFHRTDGEEYKDFLQGEEYIDATPNAEDQTQYVYIANKNTAAANYVTISIYNEVIGKLYAGDWAFFPWEANADTNDIKIQPSTSASHTLEYMLFYE